MPDYLTPDLSTRRSVNPPDAGGDWAQIMRSEHDAITTIQHRYRKLVDGRVVEMDAAEKAAVDAAVETERLASLRSEAETALGQNRDDRSLIIRALARLLLDEINALRTAAGLQPRTWTQMVTAIVGKLRNREGEV